MSKKICKKIKEGKKITSYDAPKYFCKTCSAASMKEEKLCKPKKISNA